MSTRQISTINKKIEIGDLVVNKTDGTFGIIRYIDKNRLCTSRRRQIYKEDIKNLQIVFKKGTRFIDVAVNGVLQKHGWRMVQSPGGFEIVIENQQPLLCKSAVEIRQNACFFANLFPVTDFFEQTGP